MLSLANIPTIKDNKNNKSEAIISSLFLRKYSLKYLFVKISVIPNDIKNSPLTLKKGGDKRKKYNPFFYMVLNTFLISSGSDDTCVGSSHASIATLGSLRT